MNRILLRMALITWTLCLSSPLFAQLRTSLTLFDARRNLDGSARIALFRAVDTQVTRTVHIVDARAIDRPKGLYDAGVLPNHDTLYFKINDNPLMGCIKQKNGRWLSHYDITHPREVALVPPPGPPEMFVLALRNYSQCPVAEGGTCTRCMWIWMPRQQVSRVPVTIPWEFHAEPCRTCFHTEPMSGAPSSLQSTPKIPQSRVVKGSRQSAAGRTARSHP
jgi:hypothetical protein